ncbi:hypothetical protein [Variovorax sp. 3P27G3]|uniref:hypothetical protein n=1 Tax=Variovorax sp. 3P27G3 TaxID=2502214 RepID=UPI0010F4FB67|nr:hypothetical protein [Variovorax sp. 3P27G3]
MNSTSSRARVHGAVGILLLAGVMSVAPPAAAAPEEIQVYLDDMSAPGQFGVDVHNNYVFSGASTPGYVGEQPARHVYRLTPEFYYGVSDTLELGLYVLSSRAPGADPKVDGAKVRIKYIAPHDKTQGMFWGANLEFGKTSLRVSPTAWNAELKGILGYRAGPWTLAVNPNIDWSLSRHGGPVTLDVDAKIAYALNDKTQLGLETYNELGPLSRLDPLRKNSKTLFVALDHEFDRFDVNVGIGKGLTSEADRWLMKFILGTHF